MRFGVEILGLPFAFECGDAAFVRSARRRYRAFLSARPARAIRLDVTDRNPEPRLGLQPRVERGRIRRRDFVCEGGRALVHRSPAAFESLLRVLVSLRLRDGVLVHAAAARGRLVPGKSGAGKSTFGRLLGPRELLSDELVGVTRRDGWRVWGTPFRGTLEAPGTSRSEPLEAIVFLDRHARRGLRRLPPADALVRLLRCVICFSESDAARVLAFCAAAVRARPAFLLSYDAGSTSPRELGALLRRATGKSEPTASRPSK